MNLSIAAGDLPDMFAVNAVQFSQLLEANLLHDVTDVTRQWSSPTLARIMANEQSVTDTAYRDGVLFSIPRYHFGFITQTPYFWVRRDLYEQSGSPDLRTLTDLENLMAQWTDEHDEILHVMSLNDALYSFWHSTRVWHAHTRGGGTRMWLDDGAGGIMSSYEQPEFFDVIEAWRRWYENGWVRPDFATTDWDGAVADIVSGRSAMEFHGNWRGWGLNSLVENFTPESYMIALHYPTVDGSQARVPIHFANYAYDVVRRGFAHPEVLPILTSDYVYVLTEAAVTGSMTMDEISPFTINDNHHTSGPFRVTFPHYDDVVEVLNAMDAFHAGTLDSFNFTSGYAVVYVDEILRWVRDGDIDGVGRYVQMGHRRSSLARGVEKEDMGLFLYTLAWGPSTQEILDFGGITDSIIAEGVTRIIMGLDPLENWWNVLEDWRQAGGNAMTESVNAYFGNR
jgi:putative aldouronate transport system substrate-binding protein